MSTSSRKKAARQEAHQKQKAFKKHKALLACKTIDKKQEFKTYVASTPYRPEECNYESFKGKTITPDATGRIERPRYTGSYIIGIATTHKSNLVPVTQSENPVIYSTMRRN